MQDLIGWAWQNLECEKLGITVKEHNKLVEASAKVATSTGESIIDAYQDAVNAMEKDGLTGGSDGDL